MTPVIFPSIFYFFWSFHKKKLLFIIPLPFNLFSWYLPIDVIDKVSNQYNFVTSKVNSNEYFAVDF